MSEFEQRLITLEGDDGQPYQCHLLGVFAFEGNEYALLNPVDGPLAGANAGPTVLMRFVEKDDKALFQRKRDYDELEVAKVTLAKTREDLVASLEKGGRYAAQQLELAITGSLGLAIGLLGGWVIKEKNDPAS
jgi:hypothetical protein